MSEFVKIGHRFEIQGGSPTCRCGKLMTDTSSTEGGILIWSCPELRKYKSLNHDMTFKTINSEEWKGSGR